MAFDIYSEMVGTADPRNRNGALLFLGDRYFEIKKSHAGKKNVLFLGLLKCYSISCLATFGEIRNVLFFVFPLQVTLN